MFDIGPDVLRSRTWEVEDLFRRHYQQAVRPEELADLARLADGWAAGLQLFHLATKHKLVTEHQAVLASLSRRSPRLMPVRAPSMSRTARRGSRFSAASTTARTASTDGALTRRWVTRGGLASSATLVRTQPHRAAWCNAEEMVAWWLRIVFGVLPASFIAP